MNYSIGFPWGATLESGEVFSGVMARELARVCEQAGYGAIYITDHPAPPKSWLTSGGHPSVDPFVGLSFLAGATESIKLHTHLLIPALRNLILVGKSLEGLNNLAPGRVILGVGSGYLKDEFEALGVNYSARNEILDRFLSTNSAVDRQGQERNTVANCPIWIGGNSIRAIDRAAKWGDGWSPMATTTKASSTLKTPGIESLEDLKFKIEALTERWGKNNRPGRPTICYTPRWAMMGNNKFPDVSQVRESLEELQCIGVEWVCLSLPAKSSSELRDNLARFAEEFIGDKQPLRLKEIF